MTKEALTQVVHRIDVSGKHLSNNKETHRHTHLDRDSDPNIQIFRRPGSRKCLCPHMSSMNDADEEFPHMSQGNAGRGGVSLGITCFCLLRLPLGVPVPLELLFLLECRTWIRSKKRGTTYASQGKRWSQAVQQLRVILACFDVLFFCSL